jgi:hypothetical protein
MHLENRTGNEMPFKDMLRECRRTDLYRIMTDCSNFDEDEVINTVMELGNRYAKDGMTDREKKLLTVFGCSTDEKQYSLGIDMLTEFLPRDECEKHMVAIYNLAGKKEEQSKSIPRIKAAVYLMRTRPDEDLNDVVTELTMHHKTFIDKMLDIRDERMISAPAA